MIISALKSTVYTDQYRNVTLHDKSDYIEIGKYILLRSILQHNTLQDKSDYINIKKYNLNRLTLKHNNLHNRVIKSTLENTFYMIDKINIGKYR